MQLKRYVGLLLLASTIAPAQNISGILSGMVQDASGAPFADLEIILTSSDNGFVRTTKTNQTGAFSFPDLGGGTYSLDISTTGFKRYSESAISVGAGEQRMLGAIQLQLGEVAETVSVTADVSHVKLASGERSGVMDQQQLGDLALRGRDLMDAVALMPGVVDTTEGREVASSQSMNSIYILGARSNQKNMTIDGVTNLDTGSNKSVQTMPSLASVAEVQVLMSNYAAEYGRNSGGIITVITRGGGRQFHGSAGWYHRHEEFSANDFFNNQNGLPRSRYRYNIFDYTLGGPIYIPGRFNQDRSKLFFFISEEFQRQLVSYGSKKVRVPTALERAGDFSQTFDVNAKLVPIYDPLNGKKAFPGNKVPANRFSSTGLNVLNLFPLPNFVDPNASRLYQWNYISDAVGEEPRRTDIARVDYSPHSNVQLYGRYSKYSDTEYSPYGAGPNFPLTPVVLDQPGWAGTFHVTTTFTPTLFSEFIFGVSQRKHINYLQRPDQVSRATTAVDLAEWKPGATLADPLPTFSFGGISNVANPTISNSLPDYISNTIFSFVENITKISGSHTIKAGVYIERTRKDQSADVPVRGSIAFDRDSNSATDANYAFANALLGDYTRYSEANGRPQGHYRFTNVEWYAQDNWRVRSGLTLDFGLRFYHDPPQYDTRGQLTSFVPSVYDPANAPVLLRPSLDQSGARVAVDPRTGAIYPHSLIGTFVPGAGNPIDGMVRGGSQGTPAGLYSIPPLSLSPRFGFAWDPFKTGRTAVRGGIGIFFDRIAGQPTMDTFANPPNVITPTLYYGTLASLRDQAGANFLAPASVVTLFGPQRLPITFNYSLSVQRQLSRNMIVDFAFVGSQSRRLLWERNINPIPIGAKHIDEHPENRDLSTKSSSLSDNFLHPYQGYADIFAYEFGSSSNYNSAQFSMNRRMSGGLRVGFSYTFSKALGTADSDQARVSPFFAPRVRNYGPLSFDRSHVASLSYNYTLPQPGKYIRWKPVGIVANHWEISGITRMISGGAFTPGFSTTDGQDITGTPSEGARVMVANPQAGPTTRFGRPARDSFGNVGTGVLRLPAINNWDASLYRRIRITERWIAQLRFETYNTFNHTQFSALSTTAKFDPSGAQVDPLFLQPTAARSPRRIQLALRINW